MKLREKTLDHFKSILLIAIVLLLGLSVIGASADHESDSSERILTDESPISQYYHLPAGNPYVQKIDQTITLEEGIDLTLDEIIIGDRWLSYSLILSGEIGDNATSFYGSDSSLFADDEPVMLSSTGAVFNLDWEKPALFYLTQMTYDEGKEFDSPQQFTLEISNLSIYQNVNGISQEYTIEGLWRFEFEADGAAMIQATQHYALEHSIVLDSGTLTLKEFEISPARQQLVATYEGMNEQSVGFFVMRSDDGSENWLHLQFSSRTGSEPLKLIYENQPVWAAQDGNYSNNFYPSIQKSEKLELIPRLGSNNVMPKDQAKKTVAMDEEIIIIDLLPAND